MNFIQYSTKIFVIEVTWAIVIFGNMWLENYLEYKMFPRDGPDIFMRLEQLYNDNLPLLLFISWSKPR